MHPKTTVQAMQAMLTAAALLLATGCSDDAQHPQADLGPADLGADRGLDQAADTADGAAGDSAADAGDDQGADAASPDQGTPVKPWVVSFKGPKYGWGMGIARDSKGRLVTTGWFDSSLDVLGKPLSSSGYEDVFVAMLDANGALVWATAAGGSKTDHGYNVAVDGAGNSYVAGAFSGTAVFGTTTLTAGSATLFLAKLDDKGKFLWATALPSSANKITRAPLAVDSAGNSYLVGGAMGLAKLDSSGKVLWTKPLPAMAYGVGLDSAGNSYVLCSFKGTAVFGTTTLSAGAGKALAVAKLDSKGQAWLWAKSAGDLKYGAPSSLAVDSSGAVTVTGTFNGGGLPSGSLSFGSKTVNVTGTLNVFVARLDSAGTWLWAAASASSYGADVEEVQDLAVDSKGRSTITGYFTGAPSFGATKLTSQGTSGKDIFVAQLDSKGAFTWAVGAGSPDGWTEEGNGVVMDDVGGAYVIGKFRGSATFGGVPLTSTSANAYDVFVWHPK